MPTATALDVRSLLAGLAATGVDHVLTGSVAATAYGVSVDPNDLDVAPSLAADNLVRLAGLLGGWEARPHVDPDWPETTEEDAVRWAPEPATAENLDHLFETRLGRFDVVPSRSGTYEELAPRALPARLAGHEVLVAAPCDLLPHLRLTKPKHRERAPQLERLCERSRRGEQPVPSLHAYEEAR